MHEFHFERLNCYREAVAVARWIRTVAWPPKSTHLRDQAVRAAESMVLNIAEGVGRDGRGGQAQLRAAKGSAGEVFAVLDIVDLPDRAVHRQKLRDVGAMLTSVRTR